MERTSFRLMGELYKKNRLSDDELQNFFSLPYTMGKENAPDKITDLSVVPKFTQKFTYFPYGVKLSKILFLMIPMQ